jgi:hypothetical protein
MPVRGITSLGGCNIHTKFEEMHGNPQGKKQLRRLRHRSGLKVQFCKVDHTKEIMHSQNLPFLVFH